MAKKNSVASAIGSAAASAQEEFSKDTQGCFVAAILMLSFAGCLVWGCWQVSQIIGVTLKPETVAADRSAAIKDALQVLLTIGTLFSPLLAFVLGYYFNQSQSARSKAERAEARNDEAAESDDNLEQEQNKEEGEK